MCGPAVEHCLCACSLAWPQHCACSMCGLALHLARCCAAVALRLGGCCCSQPCSSCFVPGGLLLQPALHLLFVCHAAFACVVCCALCPAFCGLHPCVPTCLPGPPRSHPRLPNHLRQEQQVNSCLVAGSASAVVCCCWCCSLLVLLLVLSSSLVVVQVISVKLVLLFAAVCSHLCYLLFCCSCALRSGALFSGCCSALVPCPNCSKHWQELGIQVPGVSYPDLLQNLIQTILHIKSEDAILDILEKRLAEEIQKSSTCPSSEDFEGIADSFDIQEVRRNADALLFFQSQFCAVLVGL